MRAVIAGFPCSGLTTSFFQKCARLGVYGPKFLMRCSCHLSPCALGKDASSSEFLGIRLPGKFL